ncbi:C39 family peptidase, partial [Streptomyces sp. KAI-27]|uniref:C39 family peptidase n=1 Tax=Streptomyces sp. KAI-27 TaxID=1169748 RepID=UPI0034C636CD
WCGHMCGIACLRMALLHRDGTAPSLFRLLDGARRHGAYVRQDDGSVKGLIYAPFARYAAAAHGLGAEVAPELSTRRLVELLDAGRRVMVSVSKEIRRPEADPPSRGGHLVLAVGHRAGRIHFRNPSDTPPGRGRQLCPWTGSGPSSPVAAWHWTSLCRSADRPDQGEHTCTPCP